MDLHINIFMRSKDLKGYKSKAHYYHKTQHAKFRGEPLFQATKQHLNDS